MTGARLAMASAEIEIRLLLDAIFLRFHYDFRGYSMASVKRRISAALVAMECATISALQERLFHEPAAFGQLLQFLTVQVSDMFRDPEFFRTFRERIVPELKTYPSVKIWVAGCSAGEELHSFAIILDEEGLLDRTILYATDISPEALAKAAAGVYPIDRIATFTENHRASGGKSSLSDYYTAAYGKAKFSDRLRARAVFSDHSLATDSAFAEVHVVSCRNVLIYFDHALQTRAIGLFRDGLVRRGFLGLGSKETLRFSGHAAHFGEFDGPQRWYQRW
jgi:chemotaxis protein methyltransferase CheR